MESQTLLHHLSQRNKTMKILICGDRNWNNFNKIEQFLKTLPKNTTIIEGDCRGADKISGYLARRLGLQVEVYPANWDKYGNYAGIKRNQQMIDEGHPTKVVAFHNNIQNSKGTKDMINRAKQNNIPTQVITE